MTTTSPVAQLAEVRQLAASGEARRRRRNARITSREMARPIGVSHTTLLAWEEGRRVPRTDAALRWLAVLNELPGAS